MIFWHSGYTENENLSRLKFPPKCETVAINIYIRAYLCGQPDRVVEVVSIHHAHRARFGILTYIKCNHCVSWLLSSRFHFVIKASMQCRVIQIFQSQSIGSCLGTPWDDTPASRPPGLHRGLHHAALPTDRADASGGQPHRWHCTTPTLPIRARHN